jgi:hypothetical protein
MRPKRITMGRTVLTSAREIPKLGYKWTVTLIT